MHTANSEAPTSPQSPSGRGSRSSINSPRTEDRLVFQSEASPMGILSNDLQGPGSGNTEAYVRQLERTVAALREREAQQGRVRGRYSQGRGSQFGGDVDERPRPGSNHLAQNGEFSREWKTEIKRWKRVTDRYGSSDIYDESEKIEDIRKREREIRRGGYVLSVYDEYDAEGNKTHVFLEISSAPLLDLLRRVITFYPGEEFDILRGKDSTDDTVALPDPYMILFAYRAKLIQSLQEDYSDDAKTHVKMLLGFLEAEHPVTSAKLTEIEDGRCEKIAFDKAWLLYQPNTPVYSCKGSDDRQIVVYSREVPTWHSQGTTEGMKLSCWEVTVDKGEFKRDFSDWILKPYPGEKTVSKLELVPAQYMKDEKKLNDKLVARGKRYFELNKEASLQDYYGDRFPRVYKDEPVRVVVDEDTYWRKHTASAVINDGTSQDYGFAENEESLCDGEGKPHETTLLRCFPEVGVFSLRDKEWALVKVDDLKPVKFREKAFKRLVIKEEYKKIIKAMVRTYMLAQPGFSDIVTGKGRGLAILLHGPPGTGKTLTAECVAENFQCPLFTISCGDLGTEPEQLEVKLKEVFEWAVTWKAILLLDEADIFLQERDVHDVKRNALVSIFLRELEYFDGILFLTTNRPGDIDEAFVSRIHITLGLNQLSREEQLKIWTIFIRDLQVTDEEKRALLNHVKDKFGGDRLNGRQIRNAVRTALALSQLGNQNVNPEHLDQVMNIGREYARYMAQLNNMDPGEIATALGRRAPHS